MLLRYLDVGSAADLVNIRGSFVESCCRINPPWGSFIGCVYNGVFICNFFEEIWDPCTTYIIDLEIKEDIK